MATMLPEHRPAAVILNRLWPLLVSTVAAGGVGFIFPQVPGGGLRLRDHLVARLAAPGLRRLAVEERDGVTFYVERTSPVRPMQLVRTPGLRREVPTLTSVNGTR